MRLFSERAFTLGRGEFFVCDNCAKWIYVQNAFLAVMETVSVGPKATTPCHVGEWPSLTLSLSDSYPQTASLLPSD